MAEPRSISLALGALLVAQSVFVCWSERQFRTGTLHTPLVELAQSVRPKASEQPLLIVRGEKEAVDADWKRRTNYEDPRCFYQSRLRGWALPRDGFDLARLVELHGLGARVLYDMAPGKNSPEVQQWLVEHGEVVGEVVDENLWVRVHRLHD